MRRPKLKSISPVIAQCLQIPPAELIPSFKPLDQEMLSQVLDLRQRICVDKSRVEDEKYLQWRYQFSSPKKPLKPEQDRRLWGIVYNQKVYGFLGIEPIQLHIKGEIVVALKVMDLAVLPELQGKGIGVWMNICVQDFGLPVLVVGSNKNSVDIVSNLFYRLADRQVYRNILNGEYFFKSRMSIPFLADISRHVYRFLLRGFLSAKSLGTATVAIRPIEQFGNCHENFLAGLYPHLIHAIRDCVFLNWRLFDNPYDKATVFGLFRGNEIVGYIAICTRHDRDNVKDAVILDWGVTTGDQNALSEALIYIQKKLLKEGYDSITAVSYDKWSATSFQRAGLIHRQDNSKTFTVFCTDEALHAQISDPQSWFLTGADGDDV